MMRSCSVSNTMKAACPFSSSRAVEPTMSVKPMVRSGLVISPALWGSWTRPRKPTTSCSLTSMIWDGTSPCDAA